MSRLTREAILSAPDITEKEVDVPEWGGSVLIRTMTKAQQVKLRREAMVDGSLSEDRLEILIFVHGVVEPQFTAEDHDTLKGKSASAMDRVLLEIYRGSGMTKEEAARIERAFPGGTPEARS
jgi:hypothetical protein